MSNHDAELNNVRMLDRLRAAQTDERIILSRKINALHSTYFPTRYDEAIGEQITRMVDHCVRVHEALEAGEGSGRVIEGRSFMVLGESGSGKTAALTRAFRKRPEFEGYGHREADCALISIEVPAPCSLATFGLKILQGLGVPVIRQMNETQVWYEIRMALPQRQVMFIHFDEVQHILQSRNPVEIQKVRNSFKSLLQDRNHPVFLIFSGTPESLALTSDPSDEQVWRRTAPIYIADLEFQKDVDHARYVVEGLGQEKAGLELNGVTSDPFLARLFHASLNRFGILVEIVQDAAEVALGDGCRELDLSHFATSYERRTGCAVDQNVFLVDDWELIDPRLSLRHRSGSLYVPEEPGKKKRGGRRK